MALSVDGVEWFNQKRYTKEDLLQGLATRDRAYPGWEILVVRGILVIYRDFPVEQSKDFVEQVCKWGGGDRNISRMLQNNQTEDFSSHLRLAHAHADEGRQTEALQEMIKLKYLGVSFASKVLRFLRPDKAVIFDSRLAELTGYALNKRGYSDLLQDCEKILSALQFDQPSDLRFQHWLISDVEGAIFGTLTKK